MKTGIGKWRELDGDNTLALDWNLNEDSHVWEIGGFEGRWVQQIWDKFHCHITIFEPQMWAVMQMEERFEGIEKIDIRPYGLWLDRETTKKPIRNFYTDGASILHYPNNNPSSEGEFRNAFDELYNFRNPIDLCLMNIEGGEYGLIPVFFGSPSLQNKIDYFWCQFHTQFSNPALYPKPVESVKADWDMYEIMEVSHILLWDYYPTAVAWKRK